MLRTENPELLSRSLGSARRAFLDTASVSFSSWENLPVLQERQPKVPTPDKAQSFPLGLFVALCGWVTCEPKSQGVCWDKQACYQRRDAQHLLAYSWWSMNNSPVPAAGPKGVFHMQFETPQSRNSHGFLLVPESVVLLCVCVHAKLLQYVWIFETPWTVAWPGSYVHGILQARILGWAIPFSRGSSHLGVKSKSLTFPEMAGGFFTTSANWDASIFFVFVVAVI